QSGDRHERHTPGEQRSGSSRLDEYFYRCRTRISWALSFSAHYEGRRLCQPDRESQREIIHRLVEEETSGCFKISASDFNRLESAALFAVAASFSNTGAIFFRFPLS